MTRFTGIPATALVLVLLGGCVAVDSPQPGRALTPRAGQTLVFGRVRLLSDGTEYRPWDPATQYGPQVYMALLRLGPRRVAPSPPLEEDGRFYWWLAPGDYAVVGNRHDVYAGQTSDAQMQDMKVLALLRVPGEGTAAYAGELVLELESVEMNHRRETTYEFGREDVYDRREEALAELHRLFGPLLETPGVSLMCAGPDLPGFDDPALFGRGRALLDADCAARQPWAYGGDRSPDERSRLTARAVRRTSAFLRFMSRHRPGVTGYPQPRTGPM